jgi:hypothetical protein
MAEFLPGRPSAAIKSRWKSSLKKKFEKDPTAFVPLAPPPIVPPDAQPSQDELERVLHGDPSGFPEVWEMSDDPNW